MKRVAVMTCGRDAPGMNAAIRAVVRAGLDKNWEMHGVLYGYVGLQKGDLTPLRARDVGGVMQKGGTFLGTAPCDEFMKEEGQRQAIGTLEQHRIDALVVIGGCGSQKGAHALHKRGHQVVGIAATIENDIYGAEMAIGVDTALDVAMEAIDSIKATTSSHRRAFVVEVTGRESGYLALMTGLGAGAECMVLAGMESDPEVVAADLRAAYDRGKPHAIAVVSEGAEWNAARLAGYFEEHRERIGFEVRSTVLGHIQRGAYPRAFDRVSATQLGVAAVERLSAEESGVMVGSGNGHEVVVTPLEEVVSRTKEIDRDLMDLARVLSS